jgi:sterol desaturase/sphingolipid hydroxylase (fatty acid hydroxylase superfamily)
LAVLLTAIGDPSLLTTGLVSTSPSYNQIKPLHSRDLWRAPTFHNGRELGKSLTRFYDERYHRLSTERSVASMWNPDNSYGSRQPLRLPSVGKSVRESVKALVESFRNNEVTRWRCAAVLLITVVSVMRPVLDQKLASLWTFLMTSSHMAARIFRTDSYEWMLAVTCFYVYMQGYGWADDAILHATEQGRVHPWRKYRLQDRYEADKQRRNIEKRLRRKKFDNAETTASSTEADFQVSPLFKVKHTPWHHGSLIFEVPLYILPLLMWDILAPRRLRRLAPFSAPTTVDMVSGVLGGLVLYDALFFVGHVAMHRIPLFYRWFHAKHHTVTESRACEQVRLSLVEEVYDVGCSIVALNLMGIHPLARSLYNIIITFLLTDLHSGFDFPWTPQNVVPFGVWTGSRRHHYHHRFGKHYYQKFFFTLDRLFGFFQKNDGSAAASCLEREPYIPNEWK